MKCNFLLSKKQIPFLISLFTFLIFYLTYKFLFDYSLEPNFELKKVEKSSSHLEPEDSLLQSRCFDRPLRFNFVQRANFWALVNFIPAERRFRCHESITLVSQADVPFIDNLIPAVVRWNGPISFAIYAPGDDFYLALDSIAYLRNCKTDLIRQYVTFHILFDVGHFPELKNKVPLPSAYKDYYNCSKPPPYKNIVPEETYRKKNRLTYPLNTARNIAIEPVQTHFIFSLDIELYPSPFFIERFLQMINSNLTLLDRNIVFVPPYFEIISTATIPETKSALVDMFENRRAFFFHEKVCKVCHKLPFMEEWMKAGESNDLKVFKTFRRLYSYRNIEPMFVSTVLDPIYDDRFFWEGAGDKLPQNYILCLMDYDFAILDNAFLVHRPGVKPKSIQSTQYKTYVNYSKHLRKNIVRLELNKIYGERKGCYIA